MRNLNVMIAEFIEYRLHAEEIVGYLMEAYEDMLYYEDQMIMRDFCSRYYARDRRDRMRFFVKLCHSCRINPINTYLYIKGIYDK